MYVTKRLGVIGAEIDGLDLEKNDDAMYAQIDSLLMEHQVLFF
ncbi:MAG: taurine dioxygenase, partial [Porticoccaceae bacterium]|nr:taurine dioxygenase [Porticoccaceae bacterium]